MSNDLEDYLSCSDAIDWQHPSILELGETIASQNRNTEAIAKAVRTNFGRGECHSPGFRSIGLS